MKNENFIATPLATTLCHINTTKIVRLFVLFIRGDGARVQWKVILLNVYYLP